MEDTGGAWCRGEYVHEYGISFLEKMSAPVRITIIYVGMGRLYTYEKAQWQPTGRVNGLTNTVHWKHVEKDAARTVPDRTCS